jgi:hypothetical protein
MDLTELNQLWTGYKVEELYYIKKIEEYEASLNFIHEEQATLEEIAEKEGYKWHMGLGRWVYK